MRNGVGLSIVAVLLLAAPLAAQERSRVVPRGDGPAMRARASYASSSAELASVERVLRLRERLELSDEQVSRLESMRQDALARWLENAVETEEMQSRMRAGYEDEDARERVRALAEARRDDAVEMRERVEALLTDEQREQLTRRSRAILTPRGAVRVPDARARLRAPRALPVPEARRAPRPTRAPRMMPALPRAARIMPAPERAPRVVPAPRPPRVRRWM